jgi:hypothetical protein
MAGRYVDDFRLERFEGAVSPISAWRGKRVALFCFSSWALGRGQLPLWQELKSRLPADAEVVGVAAEVEGERWLRGYLRQAEAGFPVLIDRKNVAGAAFGFKAGPNVVLIDEAGRLVYRRLYDASLRKADLPGCGRTFSVAGFATAGIRAPDPTYAPKPEAQHAFAEAVDLFLAGRCGAVQSSVEAQRRSRPRALDQSGATMGCWMRPNAFIRGSMCLGRNEQLVAGRPSGLRM